MNRNSIEIESSEFLSAALFDYPLPETVNSLSEIRNFLRIHAIDSLIGDCVKQFPEPICTQWSLETLRQVSRNEFILSAQDALVQLFSASGLNFAVIKGFSSVIYYPQPLYRILGDIDIIVGGADFGKAVKLLDENGYIRSESKTGDRHIGFTVNGVSIELHRQLAFLPNSTLSEQFDYYIADKCKSARLITVENHSAPILPDEENGLVILAHILHHFIQHKIGLRQLTDWCMFADRILTDSVWYSSFAEKCRTYQLEGFACALTRVCQLYLHLSEENRTFASNTDDTVCGQIIQVLFESGNMGQAGDRASHAAVSLLVKRQSIFKRIQNLQSIGLENWSIARKHKFLSPFAWLYQLFRFANKSLKRNKLFSSFIKDYKKSRELRKLLSRLGIKQTSSFNSNRNE